MAQAKKKSRVTKRGANNMARAKGNSRETNKSEQKAKEVKERTREYAEEYRDAAKELTGFVRESYIAGFQLGLLFWKRSLKAIGRQAEQWVSMQEGYAALAEAYNPWSNNNQHSLEDQIEKIFSFQREYIDRIRDLSERGIKQVEREVRERA